MPSTLDYADPFFGVGETTAPVPRGIAAAWNWRKAQTANNHPGATRPFGMVSACAYSGAYPTGYGMYDLTCDGPARRVFDRKTATGFTHFQHSGVGNVQKFYNYLRVIPLRTWEELDGRWTLTDEMARPGSYRARASRKPESRSRSLPAAKRPSIATGSRKTPTLRSPSS